MVLRKAAMKRLLKVGLSMLLLAMVLIAMSYAALRAKGISNPSSAAGRAVRSETRPISANITSIDLAGPIDLVLRRGATPSMKVSGEQRLLSNVDTTADGTTLHIGPKGMLFHHRQPLGSRCARGCIAVVRLARRNKHHRIQRQRIGKRAGDMHVAVVNGVERAAKQADARRAHIAHSVWPSTTTVSLPVVG